MIKDVCIIALVLVTVILLIRLLIIKRNIRDVAEELSKTKEDGYDRQMRMTLIDSDVEKLVTEINTNLDYQKNLKRETEASRRQLEQSISDIAHDLRTPLTVVKGNLQMLEQEDLSPKGREYLEISRRKSESLKKMVDEFFELSVLESDSKPVELCKLDAIAFLSEFVVENESLIRERNITPEITFPEKSVFIQANKEMLSRVFSNLIGNILKYAKDSFKLEVMEESDGGSSEGTHKTCKIQIGNKVEDPLSIDIDHIFDRTYRADKARSDGSAGLGLYIAKLLVEKQKGTITANLIDDTLIFEINF